MSTPPELEFLAICFGLVASFVAIWMFIRDRSKPARIGLFVLSGVLILIAATSFGYRMSHKASTAVASTTPAPTQSKAPAPIAPTVKASIQPQKPPPLLRKRHIKLAAQTAKIAPPAPSISSSPTMGSDNTIVGNVPPVSKMGSGNTIIGATDAYGNTILNQGGTAIGHGASADSSSIAIGAGAHAGGASHPPQL